MPETKERGGVMTTLPAEITLVFVAALTVLGAVATWRDFRWRQ